MKLKVGAYLLIGLILLVTGCASSSPSGETASTNALTKAAQNIERRAAQAFASGEFDSAAAGYESAALVYETLALAEPQARARLSQARAAADAGRTGQAQQIIDAVLQAPAGLGSEVLITAHGRAAALSLANDVPRAQTHLQSAFAACAGSCPQSSALLVLRARAELATGNAAAASNSANAGLSAAQNPNDRANALRARAQAGAALGQHSQVQADAQQALALDQDLGQAQRVLQDLQLLQAASTALGDTAAAQRYSALAQRAQQAAATLRGEPAK
jgi:hypothetical protein